MSIGAFARRALGPLFPMAGAFYRALFENVERVSEALPTVPPGGLLLDVGGGDGALLNPILEEQRTIRAVLIDVAPTVGGFVGADVRARVELRPSTSVRDYIDSGGERPAVVLVADVFHHVDPSLRLPLIRDLFDLFDDKPMIAVKDVEPKGLRARLGFAADRYISGDRNVNPIRQADLIDLFREVRPDIRCETTALSDEDPPNYCLVFSADA
jgi:hypothetical protein